MKMKNTLIRCSVVLSGLILLLAASPSSADIMFEFRPTPSGGVQVTGMGSGFADRALGIASSDWDIQDFVTNFLKDTYTLSQTGADVVAGTFTNVTTGVTESLLTFDVDRDGGPSLDNDLDFDTTETSGGPLTFALNDEFLLQMTATFNPGTLAFSDLILGTHIDVGHTEGAGIAEESFGITTVKVIPEPAALVLVLACVASIAAAARRSRHG